MRSACPLSIKFKAMGVPRLPKPIKPNVSFIKLLLKVLNLCDGSTRMYFVGRADKIQFAPLIFCHEDHAVAFNTPHFSGCQIGYYDHLFINDFIWFEVLCNSR